MRPQFPSPPASAPWLASRPDGVVVNVRVVPRASRNEVAGVMGDALRIRLQAPPVEGKANQALVEFLAERLGLARRQIAILAGDRARGKRVLMAGLTAAEVRDRIDPARPA